MWKIGLLHPGVRQTAPGALDGSGRRSSSEPVEGVDAGEPPLGTEELLPGAEELLPGRTGVVAGGVGVGLSSSLLSLSLLPLRGGGTNGFGDSPTTSL
jgi:hypothetical protein